MPIVRQLSLRVAGLSPQTPTMRLALLSDIHIGNRAMDPTRLRAIVARVNREGPDLVLIAGDFVTGHAADGAAARAASLVGPLSALKARLGVVAVLGNHDYWTDAGAVQRGLARAGLTVLADQAVRRGPLAIIGIGDRFSGHERTARALARANGLGGVPVVLTHSPDLAPDLPQGLDLVLAGHTHCGQVVLPLIGPMLVRSSFAGWRRLYDARYRCGVVREGRRTTLVTAGLGSGTVPVRLGAPPDLWLVTLMR